MSADQLVVRTETTTSLLAYPIVSHLRSWSPSPSPPFAYSHSLFLRSSRRGPGPQCPAPAHLLCLVPLSLLVSARGLAPAPRHVLSSCSHHNKHTRLRGRNIMISLPHAAAASACASQAKSRLGETGRRGSDSGGGGGAWLVVACCSRRDETRGRVARRESEMFACERAPQHRGGETIGTGTGRRRHVPSSHGSSTIEPESDHRSRCGAVAWHRARRRRCGGGVLPGPAPLPIPPNPASPPPPKPAPSPPPPC